MQILFSENFLTVSKSIVLFRNLYKILCLSLALSKSIHLLMKVKSKKFFIRLSKCWPFFAIFELNSNFLFLKQNVSYNLQEEPPQVREFAALECQVSYKPVFHEKMHIFTFS